MKTISIAAAACLVLALLIGLGGCTPLPFARRQDERRVELPEPAADGAPEAPVGDSRAEYDESVTLYYLSGDGQQLVPVIRTFWLSGGDDLIERVMERLLAPPESSELRQIAPNGTRLLSFERSNGVVTLDLSSEALGFLGESPKSLEQERCIMLAAIANTLAGLPGVRYVNVLIGGQAQEIAPSLPAGALSECPTNLNELWGQVQADQQRFDPGQSARRLDSDVVLYFASGQGEWLLPEVRRVRFESDNLIIWLLRELVRGPSGLSEADAVMPGDLEPLLSAPGIVVSSAGKRLISLPFTPDFTGEIERRGVNMRQFYGALTLTLCRFVPEVDGIVVRAGSERVERVRGAQGEEVFEDGIMTPAAFEPLVGDVAEIYLGSGDGLQKVTRVLDPYSAETPSALLEQLLLGPSESEENLVPVVPDGISGADLLGIRIEGGTALLNLSSNFYRCCQALNETQETQLIYAMVNTLTELDGVRRVRFYVDGEVVDTLARAIYMRGELMRNPGIVVQPGSGDGNQA